MRETMNEILQVRRAVEDDLPIIFGMIDEAAAWLRTKDTCRARIHDRGGDLRLLVTAWSCQAATWYSCVSPPRTCFRRIRCSARLISGGRASV